MEIIWQDLPDVPEAKWEIDPHYRSLMKGDQCIWRILDVYRAAHELAICVSIISRISRACHTFWWYICIIRALVLNTYQCHRNGWSFFSFLTRTLLLANNSAAILYSRLDGIWRRFRSASFNCLESFHQFLYMAQLTYILVVLNAKGTL